jgi:hypothetical protein
MRCNTRRGVSHALGPPTTGDRGRAQWLAPPPGAFRPSRGGADRPGTPDSWQAVLAANVYLDGRSPLRTGREECSSRAIADLPAPLAHRWRTPDAQAVTGIAVQNRPAGRCTMFGSAAFRSMQAIIRAADGTAAATVPQPASDHDARPSPAIRPGPPPSWSGCSPWCTAAQAVPPAAPARAAAGWAARRRRIRRVTLRPHNGGAAGGPAQEPAPATWRPRWLPPGDRHSLRAVSGPVIRVRMGSVDERIASDAARPTNTMP